jgi:hypothetical protein
VGGAVGRGMVKIVGFEGGRRRIVCLEKRQRLNQYPVPDAAVIKSSLPGRTELMRRPREKCPGRGCREVRRDVSIA